MLFRLFRKINKNKWMFLCLLIGVTLAVAMISSIPIYSRGSLQKMLVNEMENYKDENKVNPGLISIKENLTDGQIGYEQDYLSDFNKRIKKTVTDLAIPIISNKTTVFTNNLMIRDGDTSYYNGKDSFLGSIDGFEQYINITKGKMYSKTKDSDGCYEVIISEQTLEDLRLTLGKMYYICRSDRQENAAKVKIVGVYTAKNPNDEFWLTGINNDDNQCYLMDYQAYITDYVKEKDIPIDNLENDCCLDYTKITTTNYNTVINSINTNIGDWAKKNKLNISLPLVPILNEFVDNQNKQQSMMMVFETPVFLLLIIYISMVSSLIVQEEKNEISVLQSRGITRGKIIFSYFIKSVIVSIIALILGPPLGLLLCKIIGASNGFLQFVDRKPIVTTLILKDYGYSLIAIAIFIVTMLIPVFKASKNSIVTHKQNKSRKSKAFWQKYYLDVVLLLISLYGIENYNTRQRILSITNANAGDIPIDPIIYFATTFFILSLGLVFIRIYPYIIKLILRIRRKKWAPSEYLSLINVGRSDGKNQFIMIFIILTLAIGVFDIKAAGTMNNSAEEKDRYLAGADVVLTAQWQNNWDNKTDNASKGNGAAALYEEPPYNLYSNLAGTESTTKVFKSNNATITLPTSEEKSGINLMGIITNEFGKTAWFDPALMKPHWYEYLNLMSKNPQAVLLSKNCQKDFGINPGDNISISWNVTKFVNGFSVIVSKMGPLDFTVYGFVDYWPSYNPIDPDSNHLVIANLPYLQSQLPVDKYQIWIKKKTSPDATKLLYDDIINKKLTLESFHDVDSDIITFKNDVGVQGINGALNLSFIAIILVTALGFLIYWVLSIKARNLQMGILRSMGMSLGKILRMLLCEQVLISAVSVIIGIEIGNITSKLFLPELNIIKNTKDQILPLKVITFTNDFIKLAYILLVIFSLVFTVLIVYISKIKMDQAVKLGED